MSEQSDGGPAMPVNERNDDGTHFHTHKGLSLRDYFAGQAISGLLFDKARTTALKEKLFDENPQMTAGEAVSRINHIVCTDAYAIADAMLQARKAPQ